MTEANRIFIGILALFVFAFLVAMTFGNRDIAVGIAIGYMIGWLARLIPRDHA